MEHGKMEMLEHWDNGIMEYWNIEGGVRRALPTIPSFRHSIIPICLLLLAGCSQPQASVRVPAPPGAGHEGPPPTAGADTAPHPPSEITSSQAPTAGKGLPNATGRVWEPSAALLSGSVKKANQEIGGPGAPPLAAGFAPVKIGILPLTELASPSGAGQRAKLRIFVTMLDAFGSPVKAPGVLRFELYEYVPRSAQSKGPRLALWPDLDLTAPAENHRYWRDFLRAYEFELDAQAHRDKTYILEATCLSPDGKRLACEYTLKGGP